MRNFKTRQRGTRPKRVPLCPSLARQASVRPHVGHRYHASNGRSYDQGLSHLRLRLHPRKNTVFPVSEGIRFLGYRVFPTHRLLVKDNVRRLRRRVRRMQRQYANREIGLNEIRQRLMSWSGHARQADTYLLRKRLFATIGFRRTRIL